MADLQGEPGATGVQPAVHHQRAADTQVAGGDQQQVPGVATGAVAVLGKGDEVGVVADRGGQRAAGRGAQVLGGDRVGEQLRRRGVAGPAEDQRGRRGPPRLAHRVGQRERGAQAAAAVGTDQRGAGGGDGGQQCGRIGAVGHRVVRPLAQRAAESDQRHRQAVGVQLGGEHHRSVGGRAEPVRGPPAAAADRVLVDGHQAERGQLAGDGAGRGPGDAEGAGQCGAGGRATGVDELQGRAEQAAAPVGGAAVGGFAESCRSVLHSSILTLCRS